jgi:bacillithiol biosynthesis deacetylase BshB1
MSSATLDVAPLDVMAIGAHPDDVEIACGGTLALLARQGYRVGIVDLTDGEPTPHSTGPEMRLAEAAEAAKVLGVAVRVTLDLPNRRLFDTFDARVALAKQIRIHRPRLVIGLHGQTPMGSPDHYQAGLITDAAVFYARLTKWDEYFDGLPVHSVGAMLHCFLAMRSIWPTAPGAFVVDISDTLEVKLAAINCYRSQFPPQKSHYLDRFHALARQLGTAAGFAAGEVLASPTALGTRDLMGMLFGPRSA